MEILHYALGFPPYRTGGLTKFCIDLMTQQAKDGHSVGLLWPGQIGLINKKTTICEHKNEIIKDQVIQNYEIINPVAVPLDEGIMDIQEFTKNVDGKVYLEFLEKIKPNVIHIHTLMGLHKSFLDTAKKLNIKLVFSAHDFFPICPKVTLVRNNKICSDAIKCDNCNICNVTALSKNKILILQSPIYRNLKNSFIVKKMRKRHRDEYLNDSDDAQTILPENNAVDYQNLREYYYLLLKLMDVIHYNSHLTKKIYDTFFSLPNNCVLNVTHSDIKDHKKIRDYSNKILRIRYLGPQGVYKGFFLLKEALDLLWTQTHNFCLDVHFMPTELSPYIRTHERYTYQELPGIFDDTDVLVAPSIWYETFGFTVLEALSYGVPVIISGTVGAKDILIDNGGFVVEDINADKLYNVLKNLTKEKLQLMNEEIVKKQPIMTMKMLSEQLEKSCYR